MSDTRVKQHPTLGILVCTDGHVMVPATSNSKAHWTLGSDNGHGYRQVQIYGKRFHVHHLVAETFLGPIPEGMEIDHINRVKDDNRIFNIRIVSKSTNLRNTSLNDRVDARGGTHWYEDKRLFYREYHANYYAENKNKIRGLQDHYKQSKRKTHRRVHFADGSYRWIPNEEAVLLLAIPVKERHP